MMDYETEINKINAATEMLIMHYQAFIASNFGKLNHSYID